MIKQTLVLTALLVTANFSTATNADAKRLKQYQQPTVNFHDNNLEKVSARDFNCDELLKLAKEKTFLLASGNILAESSLDCLNIYSSDYDSFKSQGAYIRAKDGLCVSWSCIGVRPSDGDST